jgi:Peptidase MA superfamily
LKHTSSFSLLTFLLISLFTTRHTDDGFTWQTLESGMLKVHWYEGDGSFGQAALETAQAGLTSIRSLVSLDLEQPIEIFIYANTNDLQNALVPGQESWIAGHADPESGLVQVLIEPGPQQGIAMEQRIPHELMHVMLYRRVGPGYKNLPGWLREGMATLAEMYPNPDYDHVLEEALTNNALIPLKDLCVSFPEDTPQAFLAYAESRSFTSYLYETYGATGLQNLAAAYADGVDCEHGTERAFGVSLSNLEQKWTSSLRGENDWLPALQNISPYLVLLCLVLIIPLIGVAGTLRKKGTRNEPGTEIRR